MGLQAADVYVYWAGMRILPLVAVVAGLAGQGASPWMKWVEEDVVSLIGAEEKKAYLALQTDEERTQFVKQFWARRDPSLRAAG